MLVAKRQVGIVKVKGNSRPLAAHREAPAGVLDLRSCCYDLSRKGIAWAGWRTPRLGPLPVCDSDASNIGNEVMANGRSRWSVWAAAKRIGRRLE